MIVQSCDELRFDSYEDAKARTITQIVTDETGQESVYTHIRDSHGKVLATVVRYPCPAEVSHSDPWDFSWYVKLWRKLRGRPTSEQSLYRITRRRIDRAIKTAGI